MTRAPVAEASALEPSVAEAPTLEPLLIEVAAVETLSMAAATAETDGTLDLPVERLRSRPCRPSRNRRIPSPAPPKLCLRPLRPLWCPSRRLTCEPLTRPPARKPSLALTWAQLPHR